MKREYFIMYLNDKGCKLVREDKSGYSIYENVENNLKSGVPVGKKGYLNQNTICLICKVLNIETPDECSERKDYIDKLHKKFGNN